MIKAILVDDEVHCLDTLSILLEEYCPQVTIAQRCSSAKEALKAIDQHQPALVFLDIEMPGMNGLKCWNSSKSFHFPLCSPRVTTSMPLRPFISVPWTTCSNPSIQGNWLPL